MKLSFAILLLVSTVILFCSCSNTSTTDYEKLADKIAISTAKKLEKEKGLILLGTGGRMMNEIEIMSISFEYRKDVEIDQARKLLIEAAEEYLSEINADEKIRPYLHNYPFTPDNIKIEIYFRGIKLSFDKVHIAAVSDGKVSYYIKDDYTLRTIKVEAYEEASKATGSHN